MNYTTLGVENTANTIVVFQMRVLEHVFEMEFMELEGITAFLKVLVTTPPHLNIYLGLSKNYIVYFTAFYYIDSHKFRSTKDLISNL